VTFDFPDALQQLFLPAFMLQPLVENAIKHGTSQLLGAGHIHLSAIGQGDCLVLTVEDNAGLYAPSAGGKGLGMSLVDRRLRGRYGEEFGLHVECEPEQFTRVILRLPLRSQHAENIDC